MYVHLSKLNRPDQNAWATENPLDFNAAMESSSLEEWLCHHASNLPVGTRLIAADKDTVVVVLLAVEALSLLFGNALGLSRVFVVGIGITGVVVVIVLISIRIIVGIGIVSVSVIGVLIIGVGVVSVCIIGVRIIGVRIISVGVSVSVSIGVSFIDVCIISIRVVSVRIVGIGATAD
ncbi:hypothetical protein PG990_007553 [Apiospora arundinis]